MGYEEIQHEMKGKNKKKTEKFRLVDILKNV